MAVLRTYRLQPNTLTSMLAKSWLGQSYVGNCGHTDGSARALVMLAVLETIVGKVIGTK